MRSYIVTYDLRAPGRDYNRLYEHLRSYPRWGRVTESTWVLVTAASATQIREQISKFVDYNDRIFVVKSGGEAAWKNALCETDWLMEELPK